MQREQQLEPRLNIQLARRWWQSMRLKRWVLALLLQSHVAYHYKVVSITKIPKRTSAIWPATWFISAGGVQVLRMPTLLCYVVARGQGNRELWCASGLERRVTSIRLDVCVRVCMCAWCARGVAKFFTGRQSPIFVP